MKRIRKLGVVAIAAMALSAIAGVSAASGADIVADKYPAALKGQQPEGEYYNHELSIRYHKHSPIACHGPTFTGEVKEQADSVTVTPENSQCYIFSAPMKMNGCKFIYHFGTELPDGSFTGTFDIGPSGCGPIQISFFNCSVTIGAQTGLKATYENVGTGKEAGFDVTAEARRLKYSQGALCEDTGTGTFEDGEYTGTWHVQSPGGTTGVELEEEYSPGFFAEEYPATVGGSQVEGGKHVFAIESGITLNCDAATFAGGLTGPASTTTTVYPTYTGCRVTSPIVITTTVAMNGCGYTIHSETDAVDVSCPEGKSIQISAGTCKISVSAQSGLSSVSGELTLSSGVYGADVVSSVNGITYNKTQDGFLCPLKGTGVLSNGAYTGETTAQGTNVFGEPISIWAR